MQVHTDEGITGIGEVDSNPWAVKAFIEAPGSRIMALGLTELLKGQDPHSARGDMGPSLYFFGQDRKA
jgi:L-alanine-DL-glutamate epimerase-like enolase superfamily enzyme